MSFQDPKAQIGYAPSLALFEKPSINTGVLSHKWIQHTPLSQSTSGVIEFNIPGASSRYINLKCSTLQVTGKIVDDQGKNIDSTDNVSLVNAPLHSLWQQVDISLQNKVINANVGPHYAYKAYLDLLLNCSAKAQDYQLTSQLFYKDQSGQMENLDVMQGGLLIRQGLVANSSIVQLEGPLCLDLCEQDRYIINGVPISIKLWLAKNNFYIMSKDNSKKFKFHIDNIFLNACVVEVSPAILVGHDAGLQIAPALYPFSESQIIVHDIAKGARNYQLDNLFQGVIPSEVVVGLVSSKGFNGHFTKNPFNFQHFNCNYCSFCINGESVPRQPLKPHFKLDKDVDEDGEEVDKDDEAVAYTEAYLSLFGHEYSSAETSIITYEDFPKGYCIYRFRISQDTDGDDFISLSKQGLTRLTLNFREGLKETVNIIIYARFPRVMQIDNTRKVVL